MYCSFNDTFSSEVFNAILDQFKQALGTHPGTPTKYIIFKFVSVSLPNKSPYFFSGSNKINDFNNKLDYFMKDKLAFVLTGF